MKLCPEDGFCRDSLHGVVLHFLDLEVAVNAVPGDGKEDYYSQGAAYSDRRRFIPELAPASDGALVFCKHKKLLEIVALITASMLN